MKPSPTPFPLPILACLTASLLFPAVVLAGGAADKATADATATATADATITREHFVPPGGEAAYRRYHYTPVLRVGNQVIVSGIPAAVGDTYEEKVRWMFDQLQAQLALAGATMADVVELTSYHAQATDTAAFTAEFARFVVIHQSYFPSHYPAWTAVGNTSLLATGAPVELRAVAIIGSGRLPRLRLPEPAPESAPAPAQ